MLLISGGLVIGLTAIVMLDDVLFTGGHHFLHLQLFYFYLAMITYYLSFKGYELYSINKPVVQPLSPTISVEEDQLKDTGAGLPRSQARTQQELEAIKVQIIEALETDRLFLNPELTVKELAQHIACPSAVASLVINQYFQMNFRNLINTYRVEEVQKQLRNPPAHLSILGIALDCGFNSEASFYRIFRQQTGLSPNDFIKRHQP